MARTPIAITNAAVIQRDGTNDDAIEWVRAHCFFTDEDDVTTLFYTEDDHAMVVPRGAWSGCPISDLVIDDRTVECPVDMPEVILPLRPYQVRPVDKMVAKGGGILEAPTGAGKTIMGLHIAARQGQRTLVLVHTKDLLSQWQTSAQQVLDTDIGVIGAGQWDEEGHPIVVAMVQTLMRYEHLPPDWLAGWGMVLLDEAHRCPATSFAHVMQAMPARLVYGVTATPTRRDGMHPLMHAIIGPTSARIKEDVLVKEGNLLRPTVTMVATDFDSISGRRMTMARNQWQRQAQYQKAITELAMDEDRTRLIARTVASCGGKSQLVLSDRIEHLYDIERAIHEANPELRTFVVTGRLSKADREDAIEAMRIGGLDVMLATQLADEGLDIKRLDTLHLTFPSRAMQKLQQKVGRIMRTAEGKQRCHVYDYVDPKVPVLRGQAKDRFMWYGNRGIEMKGWQPAVGSSIKRRLDRIRTAKG